MFSTCTTQYIASINILRCFSATVLQLVKNFMETKQVEELYAPCWFKSCCIQTTSFVKINKSLLIWSLVAYFINLSRECAGVVKNQHCNRLASFVESCSKFTSLLPICTRKLKQVEAAKSNKLTLTRNNYAENTSSIETCKLEALILALACP